MFCDTAAAAAAAAYIPNRHNSIPWHKKIATHFLERPSAFGL
jgi:hypothetical protein